MFCITPDLVFVCLSCCCVVCCICFDLYTFCLFVVLFVCFDWLTLCLVVLFYWSGCLGFTDCFGFGVVSCLFVLFGV